MCVSTNGRRDMRVRRDEEWGSGVNTWRKESDVGVDRGEALVLKRAFYETHWVCHSDFSHPVSLSLLRFALDRIFSFRATQDNEWSFYWITSNLLTAHESIILHTVYIIKNLLNKLPRCIVGDIVIKQISQLNAREKYSKEYFSVLDICISILLWSEIYILILK